ncbi:Os08g0311850 [Oryza sativa Japonica Group]|uniref:Os08g0311850 protein n=1 Tax=Oryza sativa subsp. japonica TaxID=39947 RepID=Q69IW6_ORYSJ|nr:hypothetical protein [Oryza sativa Japonica Group]BAT04846.1 Os08g0311850 [Oryza sativa Japonica Group]
MDEDITTCHHSEYKPVSDAGRDMVSPSDALVHHPFFFGHREIATLVAGNVFAFTVVESPAGELRRRPFAHMLRPRGGCQGLHHGGGAPLAM